MNLWPFHRKPVPISIRIVEREVTTLRLHEWQADARLCGEARKVMDSPHVRLMVQVLHNSSPAFWFLPQDAGAEIRALHQARIEGYNLAIANLDALGEHKAAPTPLAETFGVKEEPESD